MRTLAIIVVGALALAACSRTNADGSQTIATANGQSVTVGKQPPANLPAFAAIMPGGKIDGVIETPTGGIVNYTGDAKPLDVVAFYDKTTTDAGIPKTLQSPGAADGGTGAIYGDEKTGRHFTVSAGPEGGHTKISLTYNLGGAKS